MADPEHLLDLPSADHSGPPDEIARPALAHFLWSRGIDYRTAAVPIGKSHERVRQYCLPFDDPRRVEPDPATAERIERWTRGVVPAGSFKCPLAAAAVA